MANSIRFRTRPGPPTHSATLAAAHRSLTWAVMANCSVVGGGGGELPVAMWCMCRCHGNRTTMHLSTTHAVVTHHHQRGGTDFGGATCAVMIWQIDTPLSPFTPL